MVLKSRAEQVERLASLRDRLADEILAARCPARWRPESDRARWPARPTSVSRALSRRRCWFLLEDAGVYASAASSCSSGAQDPSHVLAAMGYDRMLAGGSLRLSLGYETTDADVDQALAVIPDAVARLRAFGKG